eukprot:576047-Pyramimonas_sp.AAC.1
MTDSSGAKRARFQLNYTYNDADVPTLLTRAISGPSFLGILPAEPLRTALSAAGGQTPGVINDAP